MAEKPRPGIKHDILIRVRWLYVLFIVVGVAIFLRILFIQYGPEGDELRKRAVQITYERVTVEASRGDILARDGRLLATSVPRYEIRMDFAAQGLDDETFKQEVDSLAICLSRMFRDKSAAAYKNMLTKARSDRMKNRYLQIAPRRVDYTELTQIKQFPILRRGQNRGGLIVRQVNRRIKPHGSLGERTIGMVNETGTKLGIEGAFDDNLKGIDGSVLMQRVSGTFRVPIVDPLNVEPVNGIDVVTTLDVDIQDVAESALKRQLDYGNAQWGTVVLMEVATGEIRAMANLTRKSEGVFVEDFNYAIGMNLEPGSTFKLASLITLVEDAGMSLDREFDTEGGRARVGGVTVVDDHKDGVLSLRKIFEHSSNIGFAKAVNDAYGKNPGRFVDFVSNKLGMDKNLDMQIAGGQTPVVWRPGDKWWNGMTLTMMSYGYGLNITPMHTLTLYNAIANNGKMVRPKLVTELREYGQPVKTFPTEVINSSICSSRTLKEVRTSLEGVVEEGTARVLKNPYYKVAGKTGTAQIAQGSSGYTDRYGGRHYLATLVGYFPADNPKYSCIVAIKTYYGQGSYRTYYGASLSGPVFRAIADRVYASSTEWQPTVAQTLNKKEGTQPAVKGGHTEEIKRVANKLTIPLEGKVRTEWARTNSNDSVTVLLPMEIEEGKVPNVKGMGLKEAVYLLEKQGLAVQFYGRGRVKTQSVEPGAKATRGTTVTLTLGVD